MVKENLLDFKPDYDNFIFDIGNVLLTWSPQNILAQALPGNPDHATYLKQTFQHPDWLSLDRDTLTEAEALPIFSQRTKLPPEKIKQILKLAKTTLTPIESSVNLLKELAAMNKNLYALTNMSSSTFEHVRHFDFWRLFQGVVVSGHIKITKPDAAIFHHILEKFNLDIHKTIFIDDTKTNTQGAENIGLKSIVFTNAADFANQLRDLK